MRYLFLVKMNLVQSVSFSVTAEKIRSVCSQRNLDYELVYTGFSGEEEEVVRKFLNEFPEHPLRVIVCGNLESLHFAVNGLVGNNNVEIGFLPCDGNYDFFSSFPQIPVSKITNIEALLNGQAVDIDLVKINKRYCVTVAYFGMDTNLSWFGLQLLRFCRWCSFFHFNQQWFRRWFNFFLLLFNTQPKSIRVCVNGYAVFDNIYTIVAFANTPKYGTGTLCAPLAKIDDGLADLVFVKKLSLRMFLKMVSIYRKGLIAENEFARHYIEYRRYMNIEAETPEPAFIAMDTAVYLHDRRFHIQTIPAALRLLLPAADEQDAK
jgi:diacylglycerol kinase family enzyme